MKRKVVPSQTLHLKSYFNKTYFPSKQNTIFLKRQTPREICSSQMEKKSNSLPKVLPFTNSMSCEDVSSTCWIVVDLETNKLMGQRIYIEKQIASLTKIMTCIVVLEGIQKFRLDKNIRIKVNRSSSTFRGTSANLLQDSWIDLWDIIYGLMLPSGNDAAWLLAEVFGLLMYYEKLKNKETLYEDIESIDLSTYDSTDVFITHFLKAMNKKARSLNMLNSNFTNPHGLSDSSNYSSAKDLSILCRYCLKNQKFVEIVNTKTYSVTVEFNGQFLETEWKNTNKLLDFGWMGIKTGKTVTAGGCLASYKDNVLIIVLNSANSDKRFQDTLKIYQSYQNWKKQEEQY